MKTQYLRQISIWHPDKMRNDFTRSEYETMSQAINAAYDSKDVATLDAIERHGRAYLEYVPQPPPPPTAEQQERAKKWADIMQARAAYNGRSDFIKACEVIFEPGNYSPYLMSEAWSVGWERNGGGRNTHAMIVSTAWTALLYLAYLKAPAVEASIIGVFPANAAGLHVTFVVSQIVIFLASLPFLLPLVLIWFMLTTEWALIYVAFLLLHAGLEWCSPLIAPIAYAPAVVACIYSLRMTLDPWRWR